MFAFGYNRTQIYRILCLPILRFTVVVCQCETTIINCCDDNVYVVVGVRFDGKLSYISGFATRVAETTRAHRWLSSDDSAVATRTASGSASATANVVSAATIAADTESDADTEADMTSHDATHRP